MRIKKGDNVQIMVGKDRGKRGKVMRVDQKASKVLIEGINLFKKHQRPRRQGEKGEVVTIPHYLGISKVMLVCGACDKPTRVGYKFEEKNKVRYCKKCRATI